MHHTNRRDKCSIYTSFEEDTKRKREAQIKMTYWKIWAKTMIISLSICRAISTNVICSFFFIGDRRMLFHFIPHRKTIDEVIRHIYYLYYPSWCVDENVLRFIRLSTLFSHSWLFLMLNEYHCEEKKTSIDRNIQLVVTILWCLARLEPPRFSFFLRNSLDFVRNLKRFRRLF